MRFGKYRFTLYRRSGGGNSSWFLRIHLTKEGRHYRKSLKTTDPAAAQERAQHATALGRESSDHELLAEFEFQLRPCRSACLPRVPSPAASRPLFRAPDLAQPR